jgi:hypothetical protein
MHPIEDGEKYDVMVCALVKQDRNGNRGDDWFRSNYTNTLSTTTKLPAPTSLSVSNIGPDSANLSWTDNHDYGDIEVQFKLSSDSTWTTDSTVSIGSESASLSSLSETEEYDARVLAKTEHTTTVDN